MTHQGLAAVGGRVTGPLRLAVLLDRMNRGGAERLLLDVCRHLDAAAVTARFVCLKEEGDLGAEVRAAGMRIDVVGHGGRLDPRTVPRLVRLLRAGGVDVVLIPHHPRRALTLGRLAARLAGAANVVAVHGTDLVPRGGRCLPRHDVETLFLTQALVLLSAGQGRYLHDQEGVGRFPWRRVREVVIPNGVRLGPPPAPGVRAAAREALGIAEGEIVVGVVARLAPGKGHDALFSALARLPRHVRLVVVGGGPRAAELHQLAARLGIADRVTFTGPVDDTTAVLPAFDVAALTSENEAAPLAVLEAMAAGLPVVVTACGALPEMVADGIEGYVVPVGDVGAIARALDLLVANAGLRTAMGGRARERVARDFRIERTAQRYTRLLATITHEPLRVLFLAPDLRIGGAERQWEHLVPRLRAQGLDATVLTTKAEGTVFHRLTAAGVPARTLTWSGTTAVVRSLRTLAGVVVRPPDVVVARTPSGHGLAWLLRLLRRTPYVVAEHTSYDLLPLTGRRRLVHRALAPRATSVVGLTQRHRDVLVEAGYAASAITTIPNGVPGPDRTPPPPDAGEVTFALVANLRPEKRVADFVELVSAVNRRGHRVRGLVAGGGDALAALRDLAAAQGAHVELLGEVADPAEVWARADVACLLSESETLPLSLIEAMSHGKPLLVTAIPGNTALCTHGENGFVHPVGDLEAFADSAVALASDPELRAVMGARSRVAFEKEHSVERMVEGYAALLTTLARHP